jgi:superfamily II DNA/RNA helicase
MDSRSFADLGVSAAVASALSRRGLTEPFAVQRLVIPDVLAGHDVLVKAPTGSGKTLAFGIPIADRIEATDARPAALVLCPTRELAGQIVDEISDEAHARALSVTAVYGGVGIERQARLAARSHIVVATPGRLEDLIARGAVTLKHVRILVLDEADRMLDMGFKPAVDRIVRQTPARRQTLFFSATLEGEAGRVARQYTSDPRSHEYAHPQREASAETEHRFVRVAHEAKVQELVRELRRTDRDLALVFVRTKRGADRLVKRLGAEDLTAVAMHGNKSQAQRNKALASFERGDVDTLVATDVAARGIDVANVSHVINFDAPEQREDYVHRVGRTGRAGRSGVGVTFVTHEQARDVGRIAAELALEREFAEAGFAFDATRPVGAGRKPRAQAPAGGAGRKPRAQVAPARPKRRTEAGSGGRGGGRSGGRGGR